MHGPWMKASDQEVMGATGTSSSACVDLQVSQRHLAPGRRVGTGPDSSDVVGELFGAFVDGRLVPKVGVLVGHPVIEQQDAVSLQLFSLHGPPEIGYRGVVLSR